ENQEQVIFEGTAGNPAALYREVPGKSVPQEIKGAKILYNRKTGVFHLDGVKTITGSLEEQEPVGSDWRDNFLAKTHDFGTASRGATPHHFLPIVNTSQKRLEIKAVRVSCGCLVARVSEKFLRPNQTGSLDLALDTGRFTGKKTMTVFVQVASGGEVHEF